jgi:L-arabinose isomerase
MSSADREIWFLTGSQSLYGEDTLRQVAEQSQEVAARLDAHADVSTPVVWRPVLTSSDAIRRVILDANSDDRCVGLIGWMHTFSPAKMWIQGLDALQKPFLHLHTQAHRDIPWSTIDMDFMNLNSPIPTSAGAWARGPGRPPAPRSCGRSSWRASATTCVTSRSRRATRSRPS